MKLFWGKILRTFGYLVMFLAIILQVFFSRYPCPFPFIISIIIGLLFVIFGTILIKRKTNK